MIMRKLLIKLLVCIALLNSTHSAAADKYDAEAAALTRAAAENGLALNQSSRGLVSKLSPYQPKDAVYLPTGGIFLFEDQRSGLTLVTTTGRYSFQKVKFMMFSGKTSSIDIRYPRKLLFTIERSTVQT